MRAWWLWLALAACGGDRDRAAPMPAPVPTPAKVVPVASPPAAPPVPETPVAPTLKPAAIELPSAPGLPSAVSGLRPYMNRAEAEAALRSLTRATSWPPALRINDSTRTRVFALSATTYVACLFRSDERLTGVTLYTTAADTFPAAVRARWSAGTNALGASDAYSYRSIERWSSTEWSAELKVGRDADFAELRLEATDPVDAERPAVVDTSAPSIDAIAKLLGQPLDAATKLLGDELHVEEGEGGRPQGFARVRLAWNDARWELTLRTDASKHVDHITVDGEAADNAQHLIVMRQLERAFGPRRVVVDEVGDFAIGFGGGGRVDARAYKLDVSWTIELRRR